MKILLEIWKDRSGGIAGIGLGSILGPILGSIAGNLVGRLFGGKDDDPRTTPELARTLVGKKPTPSEPKVRQAQDRSRRRKAAAVGRQGTILTSPLGLTGDEDIARFSLLGR